MDHPASSILAIEQLYHEYHQPIQRYLERMVGSRETAEDLCQETFINALRHWEQVHTATSIRSWLYRIATNTAYDELRRRRRIEIAPLTDDHAESFARPPMEGRLEDTEPILAALHHVPVHFRLPLLMVFAGYDHKDIATALNSNPNTIKTRVYRARMHFRQHYVA